MQSVPANGASRGVSTGPNGTRTAMRIVRNSSDIVVIELFASWQAFDLSGRAAESRPPDARCMPSCAPAPAVVEDRYISDEIVLAAELIRTAALLPVAEEAGITPQ